MSNHDLWLMYNAKYFNPHHIPAVKQKISEMPEEKIAMLSGLGFTDPVLALVVSFFAGTFGIDRFLVGDTGLGVAKLLTCGGFFIWYIVDLFLIMDRARDRNLEKLMLGYSLY